MPVQTVIKLRRDSAADWTTTDPVLAEGELGVETDTNRIKIGDGTTEWTGLAYGPVVDTTVIKVKNASNSVAIPAGRLVQFAGAAGDTVTASPAVTNGSVDFHTLIGVTAAEIAAEGFGDVILTGVVSGLDTSSYPAGTLLYADPVNAGQLTSTAPAAPAFGEPVAAVTRQGAGSSGRILVRLHIGASLNDIHDVTLTSPSNGQVLQFDGTKWVNADLVGLPDQTGNTGKYLTTDGTDASWDTVSYSELTDVPTSFTPSAHTHPQSDITNLISDLSGKQATITGAATSITSSNLSTSRALVSDGSGKVAASAVTSTEIGYLDGVTSNIQSQLDTKAAITDVIQHYGSNITLDPSYIGKTIMVWSAININIPASGTYTWPVGGRVDIINVTGYAAMQWDIEVTHAGGASAIASIDSLTKIQRLGGASIHFLDPNGGGVSLIGSLI